MKPRILLLCLLSMLKYASAQGITNASLPSSLEMNDECTNPPRDSCSFYADCLENRYHCGPTGYPLGYGQAFCTKFSNERALLSPAGQTWMVDTMHCLQSKLVSDAIGGAAASATCAALEKKAFGTHVPCYLDSGLCTLPVTDWAVIVEIVGLGTLVSSLDGLLVAVEAGEKCLEFYLEHRDVAATQKSTITVGGHQIHVATVPIDSKSSFIPSGTTLPSTSLTKRVVTNNACDYRCSETCANGLSTSPDPPLAADCTALAAAPGLDIFDA